MVDVGQPFGDLLMDVHNNIEIEDLKRRMPSSCLLSF